MHPCERCGAPCGEIYRYCRICSQESQKGAYNAQTPQNPHYTHPKYENAVERKETAQDARQEAITKAHQDNMLANQMLVEAILALSRNLFEFTQIMVKFKPVEEAKRE